MRILRKMLLLRVYIATLLLTTFMVVRASAQFSYSKPVQNLQNAILNLDFNLYNKNKTDIVDVNNGMLSWLEGYKVFVEYNTSGKILNIDSALSVIQKSILIIEKLGADNPFYYYCLADLHLMVGFLQFKQGASVKPFLHYLDAKSLISSGQKKFPGFEFDGKHRLLLYFVKSFINEQLGWGSVSISQFQAEFTNRLTSELKTDVPVYKREVKLMGMLLFSAVEPCDRKKFISDVFIDAQYTQIGPLESLAGYIWFKKSSYFKQQGATLRSAVRLNYHKSLNILNLRYGSYLLNNRNDSAIYYINEFLARQKNRQWRDYASFKASLYWFANSNTAKALSIINGINTLGPEFTYEDKQAIYEAGNSKYWVRELVQARLLFDGGNYHRALGVLLSAKNSIKNYSTEQKLEYSYRLARVYHKLDDLQKAGRFYKMVINSGMDDRFYYPSYSAYYLGVMYELAGYADKAMYYFEKCQKLDSPIYKASIHKRAEMALRGR